MNLHLHKVDYSALSSKQQENYNFQKLSAVLADYGFTTIRLTDDWNGADFLALHCNGETLKVQLKGRITVADKYQGKGLWVAAPHAGGWYFYPHDEAMSLIESVSSFQHSQSWRQGKLYSWHTPSQALQQALSVYFIEGTASAG